MKKNKELKELIIDYMEEKENDSYLVKDITQGLKYTSSEKFKEVVKTLASLERDRKVSLTEDGQFKLVEEDPAFEGTFSGTERGFGFVGIPDYEKDIFISPKEVNSALHGDTVRLEILKEAQPWNDKGAEGRIVEILERATEKVIGEFHSYSKQVVNDRGVYGYVKPEEKKLKHLTVEIQAKGIRPVDGQIIMVEITEHSTGRNDELKGIAIKVIGHRDDPGIDILSIAYKHGINPEFPEAVLKEIEEIPDTVLPEEMEGRTDLRDQKVITIDGESAKDLDDAINAEKLDNGNYKLGVHIADVSHYVREGSAIDKEAFERGTSSYLIDRVIPMLPQKLSNGICSLHPNTDRLTLSCDMEINKAGKIVNYNIYPSVISSYRRMSYNQVNGILMDKDPEMMKENEDVVEMLQVMEELHITLEKKRENNGAISFDSKELEIKVDEDGKPTEINLVERGIGERIIESFMLSANEAVSLEHSNKDLPFLYRVHEQPDEAKMQNFIEFVSALGVQVKGKKEDITPKVLQGILDKVKGEAYEEVVNTLMLRSMQRARYDLQPLGHYGLASEFYSHFTAPIRRYPDLVLHRQVHYYQEIGSNKAAKDHWSKKLPEIAEHSSMAERRAIDAEREVEDLKMAEFMEKKVGQEFEALVVSITNFGMFVQVEEAVEGLVHMSSMKKDYYEYNERGMMLIGKRTGETFRIGQEVKVKLINVDIEQYDIDFELVYDSTPDKKNEKNNKNKNNKNNKNKSNKNNKNKKAVKNKKQTKTKKESKTKKQPKNKKQDFEIRERKK